MAPPPARVAAQADFQRLFDGQHVRLAVREDAANPAHVYGSKRGTSG